MKTINYGDNFDFFDAIFCINLKFRQDRWKQVTTEFRKINLDKKVQKFQAIYTPENGSIGCLCSHREIIKIALLNNWKNVLVFEDDIKIVEENLDYISSCIKQLRNERWDLFYFGGTFIPFDFPVIFKHNFLYKISGARGGHAIAYNRSIYLKILNDTQNIKWFIRKHRALDLYLSRFVQKNFNTFITCKTIFTQRSGISDINKKFRDWEDYIVQKFEYYKKLPFWIKKRNQFFQKILPIIWLMQCLLIPKIRVVKHDKELRVK